MKTKAILIAAAACLLATACAQGPKTTKIDGTFTGTAPDSVTVVVPGADSITIPVVDGKFTAEVAANLIQLSRITSPDKIRCPFVSDGTPLTITFDEANRPTIVSECPEKSIQEKVNEYNTAMKELPKKYYALMDSLGREKMDSISQAYRAESDALNESYFSANTDNVLAASVLSNMQYSCEPAELDSLLSLLDPKLLENKSIQKMRKTLDAKLATAEGKPFTDFEVNGIKFSSFVGNGKYMLVDFWASWCGPCKGEIPNLKNIYEKYAGEDFDILSVAVWDKPQASIDTAKVYGVKWGHLVDAQTIPTDLYGIQGIPHIILFGPDGTILKRNLRGEAIDEEIGKYVQAKK